MNDLNEKNNSSGIKYFLFLGVPVMIILTVLGAYYYTTNPMTILTTSIEKNFKTIGNFLDHQSLNINTNIPYEITGNIQLKNSQNNMINFEKYNYNFTLEKDQNKEYFSFLFGINENETNIINAKLFQLEKKQYLISEKLFQGILDVTPENNVNPDLFLKNQNLDLETIKIILQKYKNILIETLDEKYVKREKTDLYINNDKVKTTKVSYLLNEENQAKTMDKIKEKILNDEELLQAMAKIQNTDQETIKNNISEMKLNYKSDIEIAIYTEGLKQNVIQYDIKEKNQNIITYSNYKDKMLNISDQILLYLKEIKQNKIKIDFQLLQNELSGSINLDLYENEENEKKETINIILNTKNTTFNIDINLQYQVKENIEVPEIKNTKEIQSLTEQERNDILIKIQEIINPFFFISSNNNI